MTYDADIDALNPSHRYSFDGVYTDSVGTSDGTNSGCATATAICEDVTNSIQTNGTTDRVTLPSVSTINQELDRKAVCGWFMTSAIQQPPCRVYGEGDASNSFAIILGFGNNVTFEVDGASFTLQIYGDTPLVAGRAYHLCMVFESSTYGDELRAYLDGVPQTSSADVTPGGALASRGVGEFGDPVGTVAMGGTAIVLVAPVNGSYNEWAFWAGADAVLTDAEVREELFEKGALPDNTITNQAGLDALASTVRSNAPLCIRVDVVGSITLTADDVTFHALASIHVQYTGTGTLTWVNTNGSNATIGSTTGGGAIVFETEVALTITLQDATTFATIQSARVRVTAGTGGPLPSGTLIFTDVTDVNGEVTATFNFTAVQPINIVARKSTTSPLYKTAQASSTITAGGVELTVLAEGDEA